MKQVFIIGQRYVNTSHGAVTKDVLELINIEERGTGKFTLHFRDTTGKIGRHLKYAESYVRSYFKLTQEVSMKKSPGTSLSYKFKVPTPKTINADEIYECLSRTHPIAMARIPGGDKHLVCIHDSVEIKAAILGINPPQKLEFGRFCMTTKSFDEWMAWVRKVINAEWGTHSNPCEITVHIPEVK